MTFSLLTQAVVLTSIQRHLNVMDVRWTLKQRCVLTGTRYYELSNLVIDTYEIIYYSHQMPIQTFDILPE